MLTDQDAITLLRALEFAERESDADLGIALASELSGFPPEVIARYWLRRLWAAHVARAALEAEGGGEKFEDA